MGVWVELVMLVVGAPRVRRFRVVFAFRVRSALVSGCGCSEGRRACQSSRHRIPIVVVREKVSGYGAG